MQGEIQSSLASALKNNPQMEPKEALWSITNEMLTNNPFQPPKDGKCPINDLPDEILGYIFSVGVNQEIEDEMNDYDSEDDGDFEDEEEHGDENGEGNTSSVANPSIAPFDSDMDSDASSDSDMFDDDDDIRVPFQVLVSHVCKRWRAVALDAHILWTSLDFVARPNLEKARTYISRSQGLPLSISIDCTFPEHLDEKDHPDHPLYSKDRKEARAVAHTASCGDPHCLGEDMDEDDDHEDEGELYFLSHQDLSSILDLIEPEVAHWGSLEFRATTYGYVQLLLSRLHKLPAAPVLESLQMFHFEDCDDYETFMGADKTAFLPFHGNAPLLKDVVFWGVHIDWDAAVPNFLNGLRDLELSFHAKDVRPSYATFEQIIKRSPELHTLTLSLSGPQLAPGVEFDADREEGGWGVTPLTIASLHEFAIQFHDVAYASALVQHLDLPAVTGLLLNFDEEDYSDFVRALLRPVKGRTEGLLQHIDHLKIAGLPCSVACADLFLDQLANLKSLNIKLVGDEEDVLFEKLVDPTRTVPWHVRAGDNAEGGPVAAAAAAAGFKLPAVFCAKLDTLTTNEADGARVQELVAARKAAGAPLARVFMSNMDRVTAKEERWLRANLAELEFFEPSDSEDEVEVYDEDGDEWETDDDADLDADGAEDEDEDDDEDGDEPPLISPLARHLGRGARRRGRMDVD